MATTSQIQKGMFIIIDDQIHHVVDRKYKTQGRQGGLIIFTAENVKSGQTIEKTVKAGTKFEQVVPQYKEMQYLYNNGDTLVFMDVNTYENTELPLNLVGDYVQYMKEGDKYVMMLHEGNPLSLRRNPSVELEVTESVDAVKGNTANAATKIVTTETGYQVKVPLFVKKGDIITINTESGEYTGRA